MKLLNRLLFWLSKDSGQLCKCTGTITAQALGDIRAPLATGGHTNFIIYRCEGCRGLRGFPEYNLQLFLKEGTPKLVEEFRSLYLKKGTGL